MMKKSGLFDVDFSFTAQELAFSVKGEQVRSYSKGFTEALQTIVKQMEVSGYRARTQEGKAIAKKRDDFREGRPKKYDKKRLDTAMQLLENNSYKAVEVMTGISVATLAREKRKRKDNAITNS